MLLPQAVSEVFCGPSCVGSGMELALAFAAVVKFWPKIEMIWPGAIWLFGAFTNEAALTKPPLLMVGPVGGGVVGGGTTGGGAVPATWKPSTYTHDPPEVELWVPVARIRSVWTPLESPSMPHVVVCDFAGVV